MLPVSGRCESVSDPPRADLAPYAGGMCAGPLIWFDAPGGAILECACGYVVISGGFNNARHAETPVLREGLV